MEIEYSIDAQNDLAYWQKTKNIPVLKKLRALIESIQESPFEGIGKPEPLKHNLAGCWSRRITHEHRIVYEVIDDTVLHSFAQRSLLLIKYKI
ncbi:Txe/YoeB family addiction module toxin [Dyadobacter crusticola]|uniref:Txe/YoeB family addiction module toxin n=1 Tax=Dyadobacter crusticola TaxID=292407 RepID=UPI0004E154B7|nr:Txe/YoeB family addiction module toxin [Dyadobacter crusticola]